MAKEPMPPQVARDMERYRAEGCWKVPQSYIQWHLDLAHRSRHELSRTYIVHSRRVLPDGRLDGMKVLVLVVENRRTGTLHKLIWEDSNQGWHEKLPSRGSVIFKPET
jgi:hypothetical protein